MTMVKRMARARGAADLLVAWVLLVLTLATYVWLTRHAAFEMAWHYGRRIQTVNLLMAIGATIAATYALRRSREPLLRTFGAAAIIVGTCETAWLAFLLTMSLLMPGK